MKPKLFLRVITFSGFIILMSGFIVLKSGVLENHKVVIRYVKAGRTITQMYQNKKGDVEAQSGPNQSELIVLDDNLMFSSKTVVAAPMNWSAYAGLFSANSSSMMISSSKSTLLADPIPFSAYKGVFATPYQEKYDSKGAVLKQGKK